MKNKHKNPPVPKIEQITNPVYMTKEHITSTKEA